jgi:hypothetical protein
MLISDCGVSETKKRLTLTVIGGGPLQIHQEFAVALRIAASLCLYNGASVNSDFFHCRKSTEKMIY